MGLGVCPLQTKRPTLDKCWFDVLGQEVFGNQPEKQDLADSATQALGRPSLAGPLCKWRKEQKEQAEACKAAAQAPSACASPAEAGATVEGQQMPAAGAESGGGASCATKASAAALGSQGSSSSQDGCSSSSGSSSTSSAPTSSGCGPSSDGSQQRCVLHD